MWHTGTQTQLISDRISTQKCSQLHKNRSALTENKANDVRKIKKQKLKTHVDLLHYRLLANFVPMTQWEILRATLGSWDAAYKPQFYCLIDCRRRKTGRPFTQRELNNTLMTRCPDVIRLMTRPVRCLCSGVRSGFTSQLLLQTYFQHVSLSTLLTS
jgi:hypothetical protein